MLLFTQIHALRAYLHSQKAKFKTIGFVPTMGALHQGHLSLVGQSKAQCDITVCSIFVNPTQFNNATDLIKYPRTIELDVLKLTQAGCDVLFHPNPHEMYPEGEFSAQYNWGALTHTLEGAFRQGHFNGVITVVKKLFDIVEPQVAYFGKKDFQQCAVINRLVQEFQLPVKITLAETSRENDGLAMSSRNTRLSETERVEAAKIYKVLLWIKEHVSQFTIETVLASAKNQLEAVPLFKLEYLSIADSHTLEPVTHLQKGKEYVVLIALWCGNVRLIDNIQLS